MTRSEARTQEFDWTVDETAMWPPRGRPRRPFGPTMLEIMRTCLLRACFEASTGYEPRLEPSARIGIAFHRTLESLIKDPPPDRRLEVWGSEACKRFLAELDHQRAAAATRPRECRLQWDDRRIQAALESVVAEASRLGHLDAAKGHAPRGLSTQQTSFSAPMVEVPVQSEDGLFQGSVDRVEHTSTGIRLIDMKSTLRNDLPERYERQVQMYAAMWRDTYGEWPIEAVVIYPLRGTRFQVRIDPETCERVVSESVALVRRIESEPSKEALATPGEVCKVCAFRPWCRPFWTTQAAIASLSEAISQAAVGWEGVVGSTHRIGETLQLEVRWRSRTVRVVGSSDCFAHLERVQPGTRLRFLGAPLRGSPQLLRAMLAESAEVFLVRPRSSGVSR